MGFWKKFFGQGEWDCHECGFVIRDGSNTCSNCGYKMGKDYKKDW